MAAPALIPLLLRLLPLLVGFGTQAAASKGLGALGASPSFARKLPRLAGSLTGGGLLPQALGFLGFGVGALGAEALVGQGETPVDNTAGLNNLLNQLDQPTPAPENDENLVRLLQQLQLQGRVPELLERSGVV